MDNQFSTQTPQTQPAQQPVLNRPSSPKISNPRSAKLPLLLALFLVLIAGASYGIYSWQHKKVNDANAKSVALQVQLANLQSQVSKDSKTSSKTTQSNTETQSRYLDIVQLGIKFQLPSTVQDVVYVMSSDGITAYLSSTSLMKLQRADEPTHLNSCDAGITGVPGPIGSIHEGSQGVGGQVSFQGPQAACSTSKAVSQLETTQENALAQAFNSTKQKD